MEGMFKMWILLVWMLTAPGVYSPYAVINSSSETECNMFRDNINNGAIAVPIVVKSECLFSTVTGSGS